MTAQAALVFGWLISSFLLWSVIAAASAATVLSFAILSEYFPKEISGRANAALNLLHVGAAFVLQSAAGLIIEQWPEARGTCPAEAHQLAMSAAVVMQLAAFAWLALPPRRVPVPGMARAANRSLSAARKWPATATTPYATAALAWTQHVELVSKQAVGWRAAAAASAVFCFGLAAAPAMTTSRAAIAVQILEVDRLADIPASDGRASAAATIDGRAALLAGLAKSPLWRAPDLMRSVSMRPEPILRPSPAPLASNVRAQQ
jgi:hypothetical protein